MGNWVLDKDSKELNKAKGVLLQAKEMEQARIASGEYSWVTRINAFTNKPQRQLIRNVNNTNPG